MKYFKRFDEIMEENSDRTMSAKDLLSMDFKDNLDFTGKWFDIFDKPAPDFSMLFSGEPGSGKTTILLEFAYYLAVNFGKVLYISSEEYKSITLAEKFKDVIKRKIYKDKDIKDVELPTNLTFSKGMVDLQDYDFIIIDSVTYLDMDISYFKEIKDIYPDKGFVLVLQHTKSGTIYRGGKEWEHEVSIYADVEVGVITIYKNRYGKKKCYDYFNDKILPYEEEQNE